MLKELQSLGLDVKVLKEDDTEVEMVENIDYGETEYKAMINNVDYAKQQEDLASAGYQTQEFQDGELVGVDDADIVEDIDGVEDIAGEMDEEF